MKRAESPSPWAGIGSMATTILIVATLYVAQDLFIPFALAALITFLLAPIVIGLQRLRFPHGVAVVTSVILALGAVVALGATLIGQLDELSDSIPKYRDTIREKVASLGGTVATIEKGIREAMPDAEETNKILAPFGKQQQAPTRVTVVPETPSKFEMVSTIVGPVIGPLSTTAIVFVLVLFMLFYMEDLRDRLVSVVSRRGVTLTTQAMAEVTHRISRYLLMTLVVNATYGIPVAIGLLLLGVPNALLWGLLATVLRFIPYLGPWLAASFPIALSFAISPGWTLTLEVLGMFVLLELISNNVIEPWLYGSRTGLSPLAIIVSAVFWTWLWGTTGLLLSVPLTLILVVSGRYVPQLRVLHTLFGDEPGLGPDARFYQRLVATNSDEATRVAEEFLERRPLRELYDAVMLPALRSAKDDETAGRLTPQASATMRETIRELAADLPALADKKRPNRAKLAKSEAEAAGGLAQIGRATNPRRTMQIPMAPTQDVRVAFVPAGDANDALVGLLLADLLRPSGIALELIPPTTISSELVQRAGATAPDVIVIAGLPPVPHVRMRHLISRAGMLDSERLVALGSEAPEVSIIAALWDAPIIDVTVSDEAPRRRMGLLLKNQRPTVLSEVRHRDTDTTKSADAGFLDAGAMQVVHTLVDAAEAIRGAVQHVMMRVN